MPQIPRDTQRVPRSCTECTRRKVKCNKQIPCEPCSKRGDHLSCTREIVRVNGKIKIALDGDLTRISSDHSLIELKAENEKLRARITEIETLARGQHFTVSGLGSTSTSSSARGRPLHAVDDLLSAFENLHIPGQTSKVIQDRKNRSSISSNHLISLLPNRELSEMLVCSSIETLGWIHCALNVPIFLAEHQAFWDNSTAQKSNDHFTASWIALFFAVLSVGAYFLPDGDAEQFNHLSEGLFGPARPESYSRLGGMPSLARIWYDASLHYLAVADFIGHPRLINVQTMAILNLLHRNLGESQREYMLLGLAINSARVIGMDKLECESDLPSMSNSHGTWYDRSSRELGRRLWWTLVICDWMCSSSRQSSIGPRSFNTRLSVISDQSHSHILLSTTVASSDKNTELPSPLHFHVLAAKLAQVLYVFTNSRVDIPFERVRKALNDIDVIFQTLPPHLKARSSQSSTLPSWIALQQLQALFLLQVNRIRLCLITIPHFLEHYEPEYDVRECGLSAANSIIDSMQRQVPLTFNKLWGTAPCISAAGIYLILDLICFRETKSDTESLEQITRIESCIQILLQVDRNDTERAQVIRKLWDIGQSWPADCPRNKHSLFQIMNQARTLETKPTADTNLLATKNAQTFTTPYGEIPGVSLMIPHVSLGGGNGTDGEWEGFPLNLDFMEFDSLDSYQPSCHNNWDLSYFIELSSHQGS